MKSQDFKKYLPTFKTRQKKSRSPIVAEAVIRKFAGGKGHEIKTLYITYSGAYRDGQQVPANVWVGHVCEVWNDTIRLISGYDGTLFEVDHKTVEIIVTGKTLKISANIVEKE